MSFGLGKIARLAGRFLPAAMLRSFGQPAALFFHGVEPETRDGRVQTNHHEITDFRAILRALQRNFEVLPLTEIDRVLAAPQKHKRSVFLMSDDGYRNTLTVAADLLAEFAMPWTLFVSTAHIGTGRPNPVFLARLFFFFAPAGTYRLPHFPAAIMLGEIRESVAQAGIDTLRFLPADKAEDALKAMTDSFAPETLAALVARFPSEQFLGWNGVRALAARGVVIGAHADHHWPMHAGQSEAYLREQTAGARARIATEVGECRFFAYPFGNTRDVCAHAWRAVEAAGFTHGFTTLSGSLAAGGNRFLLPRYGLGPRDSHVGSLAPLLSAGNARLRAWQNGLTTAQIGT